MTSSKTTPTLAGLHQLVTYLVDKMAYVIENMATKEDIARLERRIQESSAINIKHHLAVRADIGHLNRKIDGMRAGLASAAQPVD